MDTPSRLEDVAEKRGEFSVVPPPHPQRGLMAADRLPVPTFAAR